MTSALREAKAWAVVRPTGEVVPWSVRPTRMEAMEAAMPGLMGWREYEHLGNRSDRWQWCYRKGFRCVRVRIVPEGV